MRIVILFALVLLTRISFAQDSSNAPASTPPKPAASTTAKPASSAKTSRSAAAAAQLQATIDQLTQSNRDLLDLLKKQQGVLEDMQYDRRLQSRQIQSLEERLTNTMFENTQLQSKVAALEATASARPQGDVPAAVAPAQTPGDVPAATNTDVVVPPPAEPPPPDTYLPPAPDDQGVPGTKAWHRLFTLKGADAKQTDLFHVYGRTWRVVWHNQDPPKLANTSALFINAFPKDDTIPQKVCSKLGTGGDTTEVQGPGNYYLKVEASGGAWELAVEDFR